jgi:hypothetical protein
MLETKLKTFKKDIDFYKNRSDQQVIYSRISVIVKEI